MSATLSEHPEQGTLALKPSPWTTIRPPDSGRATGQLSFRAAADTAARKTPAAASTAPAAAEPAAAEPSSAEPAAAEPAAAPSVPAAVLPEPPTAAATAATPIVTTTEEPSAPEVAAADEPDTGLADRASVGHLIASQRYGTAALVARRYHLADAYGRLLDIAALADAARSETGPCASELRERLHESSWLQRVMVVAAFLADSHEASRLQVLDVVRDG